MVPDDDVRLMERCRAGDASSYAELMEVHQDAVYNALYRILGNHEDARDALQEVLLVGLDTSLGGFLRS